MKPYFYLTLLATLAIAGCKKKEIPSYTLSVTADPGGAVNPAEKIYSEGKTATVTAIPDEHYEFTGWNGDENSTVNPLSIKMTKDKNIHANFVKSDFDTDGVADDIDLCPNTAPELSVDINGCAENQKDSDNDGVTDDIDQCPETPEDTEVDANGCAVQVIYRHENGVTIKARPWATAGTTGEIDGITYTVVDEPTLRLMIANKEDITRIVTTLITDMSNLLSDRGNGDFNQDISGWDVSNVTTMEHMMANLIVFDQDISHWDVSKVNNMDRMFVNSQAINSELNNWDVSQVTNMSMMFSNAIAFNKPLNDWNTGNVTDMSQMFQHAESFNQILNNWDTSKVTTMQNMFYDAPEFNQDLSGWNVDQVSNCGNFSEGATKWTLPKPVFTNCTPQ